LGGSREQRLVSRAFQGIRDAAGPQTAPKTLFSRISLSTILIFAELLLLLRHHHLPRRRTQQLLRNSHDSRRRQRRRHRLRRLDGAPLSPPRIPLHRRPLATHVLPRLRLRRPIPVQRRPRRLRDREDLRHGHDRLRVLLHRGLRDDVGPAGLGLHCRDVSVSLQSGGYGVRDVRKLVLEFHAGVLYTFYHWRHPIRIWICLCGLQSCGVLCGFLLFGGE